ncbi:MAG: hypothetical protein AABZ67_04310 [Pseudomonadota bacterium]
MRIARWIVAASVGLAFSAPAAAGDGYPDPLAQIDPQVLFKGVVSEADVSLLFAYLRSAMLAASQGRDAPVPGELSQRAEALGKELQLRGTLAGLLILGAIEHSARQMLREPPPPSALPPAAPFAPPPD